jgi:flagellar protein FlgJ
MDNVSNKILPSPLWVGAGGRGGLDPSALQKAAQDFEAMAIGQLLAPMFDTVDSAHGLFGGGAGEETWKPMLIAEFGKHIAAHGGFGLAAPVMAAMLRMQEAQQAEPRRQTP